MNLLEASDQPIGITTKSGSKRKVSPNSLANLALGAQSRYKGKVQLRLSVLPEVRDYLMATGNATAAVERLVGQATQSSVFLAAIIQLENALILPANCGGAIKTEIRDALQLLNKYASSYDS